MKDRNFKRTVATIIAILAFWEFSYFTSRILGGNRLDLASVMVKNNKRQYADCIQGENYDKVLEEGLQSLKITDDDIVNETKRRCENTFTYTNNGSALGIFKTVWVEDKWYFVKLTNENNYR